MNLLSERITAVFLRAAVVLAFTLILISAPAASSGPVCEAPGSGRTATEGAGPVQLGDPVPTDQGPVRGEDLGSSIAFRGIPYAAAPIGNLRWRPPQSRGLSQGVFEATKFGPGCPQFTNSAGSVLLPGQPGAFQGAEDCLSLNIWSPKSTGGPIRPVMFFIHGGGNIQGAGSLSLYDGRALAEKGGVVAVTINYRLGPLGFLAHPLLSGEDAEHHSSGNYGLLDQIHALRWVQRNIRNFGGDPANVTIFGESAGGVNVACLLASPLASGLFHRAIIESGGYVIGTRLRDAPGVPQPESAEEFGLRFAKELGCDKALDPMACMRGKGAEEVTGTLKADPGILGRAEGLPSYGPNVDGFVLPNSPLEVMAEGNQNDVPVIVGTNKNEGSIFILQVPLGSEAAYRAAVRRYLPVIADQVLARYPASDYASPRDAFDALLSDLAFICPAREGSRALVGYQPRVFVYHFIHGLNSPTLGFLGAFHALELPFVFHNLGVINPAAEEVRLSDNMLAYWTNFAKQGNPNGDGLVTWAAYSLDGDAHQNLDVRIGPGTALRKQYCDFWSQFFSAPLRKVRNQGGN